MLMCLRGESTDLEGKERQVVSEAERKLRMLGSPVTEEMSSFQKSHAAQRQVPRAKLFEIYWVKKRQWGW